MATGAFYGAHASPAAGWLSLAYLAGLVQIARSATWRLAFYPGLAVGFLTAVLQLTFFWTIFSAGAVALWLVYAFWIGLFTATARWCLTALRGAGWLLVPVVWAGFEYFRSELYFLRFSWLSPGYAFGELPARAPFPELGTYGVGLLLMALVCGMHVLWGVVVRPALPSALPIAPGVRSAPVRTGLRACAVILMAMAFGACGAWLALRPALGMASASHAGEKRLRVAGMQLEFPTERQVLQGLKQLVAKHPAADLLVLSEYTFDEGLPRSVLEWCRKSGKHLVVGGKELRGATQFYNTAYVVDPQGEIVFKQAKAVPIQFFKDGLPAPRQEVWSSPWGKIGICICYDLSYTRVTDELVNQGAEALVVPTMDVADWGATQHRLHARVAPVRAAEYGIPIFRLASSGISQAVDKRGRVIASTRFPGEGETLEADLVVGEPGRKPLDRWSAPFCTAVTGVLIAAIAAAAALKQRGL